MAVANAYLCYFADPIDNGVVERCCNASFICACCQKFSQSCSPPGLSQPEGRCDNITQTPSSTPSPSGTLSSSFPSSSSIPSPSAQPRSSINPQSGSIQIIDDKQTFIPTKIDVTDSLYVKGSLLVVNETVNFRDIYFDLKTVPLLVVSGVVTIEKIVITADTNINPTGEVQIVSGTVEGDIEFEDETRSGGKIKRSPGGVSVLFESDDSSVLSNQNIGIIVGVTVGVALFVIVIVLVVGCIMFRFLRTPKDSSDNGYGSGTL